MNIYIGNLSFDTTEDQLRQAFAAFGQVSTVNIVSDRESGRPRGFAFVEMTTREEATAAINGLNGQDLNGRSLNVNEARARS
ncbi:MAG: RNA-binding protein [bacterium]